MPTPPGEGELIGCRPTRPQTCAKRRGDSDDEDMDPAGCFWCGGGPMSREHLIPEWLLGVLADVSPSSEGFDLGWDYVDGVNNIARTHGQARPEIVVRAVCESCNGGWM